MNSDSLIREVNDAVEPRWLKIDDAVRFSGICRSKLYSLIKRGAIRSACLREEDNVRGTRLINAASLDNYITKHTGFWSVAPDKLTAGNAGEHSLGSL
jgi:helix-turn-helix protein